MFLHQDDTVGEFVWDCLKGGVIGGVIVVIVVVGIDYLLGILN